jgi:hypothetical protein
LLIQVKSTGAVACHSAGSNRSGAMTTEQFYYLLFVILSFTGFGVAIAAAYVRYRRWLATQTQAQPVRVRSSRP